jgi:hypothetical protein
MKLSALTNKYTNLYHYGSLLYCSCYCGLIFRLVGSPVLLTSYYVMHV